MRKYEAIDLLDLRYSDKVGTKGWNKFLTKCLKAQDLKGLGVMLYRIQAGMDDLVKDNLNTPQIAEWFTRLDRSIRETAKRIIREKYPMPNDNPNEATNFLHFREAKRKRDLELERFLRDSSY